MAKITVTLNCQMDNGKKVNLPGETVSMDEKQARKLAAMGMVVLPQEAPAKAAPKPPKADPEPDQEPDATPGDDDQEDESASGLPLPDDLDPDKLDEMKD